MYFEILENIISICRGKKRPKSRCWFYQLASWAAEDTGRRGGGGVNTKTTSREGMLVSCWANPSLEERRNCGEQKERGRRGGDGDGGSRVRARDGKASLRKILFPFTGCALIFTCFSSIARGCSRLTPVVQLVSVQWSRHSELMRQLSCSGGEVL